MENRNFNLDSDPDNLLKDYPEEDAHKYHAFIRDVDDQWYELDFPRLLKDTSGIYSEFCERIKIVERDKILEYDENVGISGVLEDLARMKAKFAKPDKKDLCCVISYYNNVKKEHENKELTVKELEYLNIVESMYKESVKLYHLHYNDEIIFLEEPVSRDDLVVARNRIISCNKYKEKIKLKDAFERKLIKPISEGRYKYILHNLYNTEISEGILNAVQDNINFKDCVHLAEWGNMENKLRKWADIYKGAIEIYTKGEPMQGNLTNTVEIS